MWVFSGASPLGLPPSLTGKQCLRHISSLLAATMFGATISL